MVTYKLIMLTSPKSHFTNVTLKNQKICIIQPSFYTHGKMEAGWSKGSWDIGCQRGNITRVSSKIATSHTGQF